VTRAAEHVHGESDVRTAFFARLKQSKDWLKTRTDSYVKTVAQGYANAEEQLKMISKKKAEAVQKRIKNTTPIATKSTKPGQEVLPKVMEVERIESVAPVGSVASEIAESTKNSKGTPQANIIPFVPADQVNRILENVQQTEMKDEVREGLIAKLQ